jgi:hypothetical protein
MTATEHLDVIHHVASACVASLVGKNVS